MRKKPPVGHLEAIPAGLGRKAVRGTETHIPDWDVEA